MSPTTKPFTAPSHLHPSKNSFIAAKPKKSPQDLLRPAGRHLV